MEPDAVTKELMVTSLHPGVTMDRVKQETGWDLQFASSVVETAAPTSRELDTLRDLQERTAAAHAG